MQHKERGDVASLWQNLDVGMKLHPHLSGDDAVAVLNSSPQLQLFQLLPQDLPLLLLLLFPETRKQKGNPDRCRFLHVGDIYL